MTERMDIPRANIPNSAACGHWETLLADALDGLLKSEDEATFTAPLPPALTAPHCLTRRARAGSGSVFYPDDPAVPEGLVDKILAQTGPVSIPHTSPWPAMRQQCPSFPPGSDPASWATCAVLPCPSRAS